ncbi:glycerophosphodiester phosphodiesterase [Streptomyces piniterrae]|uniref:Glycerophosphodiester phosphodiesterase n=1 Tax=Streptomyces piniterrae TaxID=2571125 RepID=A0A4V5MIU5_9ACTN|nr:glycerophosphodiester phosphodiesterase family protein [Streptomyces piniterrae]TJZ42808.1 glycerophosphodiester phosphodiesterase [Streptomyces piniterrae]
MLQSSTRIVAAALAFLVTTAMSSSAVAAVPGVKVGVGGGAEAGSVRGAEAPLVIAHRGAAQHAPENTLAAVDAAHRRGLVWVENDVQRTKDGKLVVIHDTTLNRTTDVEKVFPGRAPWRVGDFTAAEIARLDAGSWFGERFAGERVPTLADYLRRLDQNGQRLLLEIKAPRRYPGIEAQILRELRRRGWLDRAHVQGRLVVQSFCARCIKTVHELAPQVRTGILGAPRMDKLARYARFTDQINPRLSAISSRWVEAVHRLRGAHGRPLEIYAWDVGEDGSARAASMRRIEGVIA